MLDLYGSFPVIKQMRERRCCFNILPRLSLRLVHTPAPNSTGMFFTFGCGSKPMVPFGVGAPPILVYFSGDWDVHRGTGL